MDRRMADVVVVDDMNEDKFRQTGRSTRMLEYAIKQAKAGKTVVIYAHKADVLRWLQKRLLELHPLDKEMLRLRFGRYQYDSGQIIFMGIGDSFDWQRMRDLGMSADYIHLVDHYSIEQKYPTAPSSRWMRLLVIRAI